MSGLLHKQLVRVPLKFVLFSACTGLLVATVSYIAAANIIVDRTQKRLGFVAQDANQDVTTFINEKFDLVASQASDPTIISAMQNLRLALKKYDSWETQLVEEYADIEALSAKPESKKTSYNRTHAKFDPTFVKLLSANQIAEVAFADPEGKIYYSTQMGNQIGSLFVPPEENFIRNDLQFSKIVSQDASERQKSIVIWKDVVHYGDTIGTLIVRVDTSAVVHALGQPVSLGETGEARLLDSSGSTIGIATRTGPRSNFSSTPQSKNIASEFAAFFDIEMNADVRGWSLPVEIEELDWSIMVVEAEAEVFAPLNDLVFAITILMLFTLTGAALLGFYFSRGLVGSLGKLEDAMQQIASNDFNTSIPGTERKDELGGMARAVEVFRANGLRVAELTEDEKTVAQERAQERTQMMQALQSAFGKVIDSAVAGDLSERVQTDFPDLELNRLAAGVNKLVETVERGVSETGNVLGALANTDLTKRVHGDYEGSFLQLKNDANLVGDKLSHVISSLKATSGSLRSATREILSGTNDLSERTTRQAASIEETSAAAEQLAETVRGNTERAKAAQNSVVEACSVAEAGGQVMSKANEAMQRISASSNKISDIIGMIDNIAFQTNLLALNASVEAARAGEAGKGFAVVAVEVRRLAQSAAEASSEVKVLIEQSGNDVASGSRLVANAAQNLDEIVLGVNGITDLMHAIANESEAQAVSVYEISKSIREMDAMTQHNAALVEETNAAIEQTEKQATELDFVVDQFQFEPNANSHHVDDAQLSNAS